MKIGLISDTHIPVNAQELPIQLAKAFAGVELILHAGDIYLPSVLDELSRLAPVYAAYGDGDARLGIKLNTDSRLREVHVLSVDGLRLGLTHTLRQRGAAIARVFETPVDIAVCGHTHESNVERDNGVLIINPGSATLPHHQLNRLGTVAILNVANGKADVNIIQLTREA
ncbi:MAG: metallophosphoesterase family protein [Chloroflexi bacterium]|nr:metallophosphoesterase family protein [Chloroflexota bacterium]